MMCVSDIFYAYICIQLIDSRQIDKSTTVSVCFIHHDGTSNGLGNKSNDCRDVQNRAKEDGGVPTCGNAHKDDSFIRLDNLCQIQ